MASSSKRECCDEFPKQPQLNQSSDGVTKPPGGLMAAERHWSETTVSLHGKNDKVADRADLQLTRGPDETS